MTWKFCGFSADTWGLQVHVDELKVEKHRLLIFEKTNKLLPDELDQDK